LYHGVLGGGGSQQLAEGQVNFLFCLSQSQEGRIMSYGRVLNKNNVIAASFIFNLGTRPR
jgi:hypothetical protein